jgi:DNA-binding transcriptional ArsR family regulator
MPELNAVGDLVLTEPAAMRALADPLRLTLLDRLRREGAATAAELARSFQLDPSAVEEQLRELETFGFVVGGAESDSDARRWQAVGKGVFFEIPDDPTGQTAARQLSNAMLLHYVDLPRRWIAEEEPGLDVDWARAAGLFNARVTLTADELRGIQAELERMLEAYLTRAADAAPAGAGPVRILSYFMPNG